MCASEASQRARQGIDLSPDSKLEPKKCGGFGVLSGTQDPRCRVGSPWALWPASLTPATLQEFSGLRAPGLWALHKVAAAVSRSLKPTQRKVPAMRSAYFFRFCTGRVGDDLYGRAGIEDLKLGSSFSRFSFEIMPHLKLCKLTRVSLAPRRQS